MISKETLARINALAQKKRTEGLTALEQEEQALLRRQYVDSIKTQVRNWLDNVEVVDHEKLQ